MSLQLNLSWEHQEETVAGCNTLTSFMAVVYTGMATAVLTGWLNKFYTNPEKWHLALSTSSFWMGAMYIQSGIVSHGYLAQVGDRLETESTVQVPVVVPQSQFYAYLPLVFQGCVVLLTALSFDNYSLQVR